MSWLFFLNICFPLYSFAIFAMYIEQYLSIHDWKKKYITWNSLHWKIMLYQKKNNKTRNDVWKKYRQCGGRSFVRLLWKDKYNCKSDVITHVFMDYKLGLEWASKSVFVNEELLNTTEVVWLEKILQLVPTKPIKFCGADWIWGLF